MYKIPRCDTGIRANKQEAKQYRLDKEKSYDAQFKIENLPWSRLMKDGVLIMEHVEPIHLHIHVTYSIDREIFTNQLNKISRIYTNILLMFKKIIVMLFLFSFYDLREMGRLKVKGKKEENIDNFT